MPEDGIDFAPEAVPEEGTDVETDSPAGEIAEEPVVADKAQPRILSSDQVRERAKTALTREGRLRGAKPFPILVWDCEVMVSRCTVLNLYERLFGDIDGLIQGGTRPDASNVQIDRTFVKHFIISCVVEPELDEEMLDDLLEASPVEFSALAAFCTEMSQIDPTRAIAARLGELDTEAQERFFAAFPGFTS